MQKSKIVEPLEIEADQLAWLQDMAREYRLPDAAKALRVVLDHAMMDGDEDEIFATVRCRRCG
jgi:hypothetical protein